jgi:hypothetical protein
MDSFSGDIDDSRPEDIRDSRAGVIKSPRMSCESLVGTMIRV